MKMEELVSYLKNTGYIFQGSEIYGGLANTWDYGPMGSILKNNIKNTWRKAFVQKITNSFEVDSSILMHPRVWEASGHVDSFTDPMIDCKDCKMRWRADNLIEQFDKNIDADGMEIAQLQTYITDHDVKCPNCDSDDFTSVRHFNLMFKTNRSVTNDEAGVVYLRPENAQGEYVNFANVQRTMRAKIPFSIAQIGKAFRNEITPGNFTFRTIEFEQMEHQTFCKPGEDDAWYEHYKTYAMDYVKSLGIEPARLRYKPHTQMAHYAKDAIDIDYQFPFGWGEINGTHNRTDFDLVNHEEHSGQSMHYLDPVTNEKFIPYVVESTFGADRLTLALLCEAYTKEQLEDGTEREVMKLIPAIAPYKVAVFPLNKKLHAEKAKEIYKELQNHFMTVYDETASIGKRYRRQDGVGTPFCITIDDETINNGTVTLRDRDTMEQIVLKIGEVENYVKERIVF